jgi:hypothetical protein
MSCVGRDLRREQRLAELARTPGDRLRLALALGQADAERYAAAHGVTVEDARRVFARRRRGWPQDAWDVEQVLALDASGAGAALVETELRGLPGDAQALWKRIHGR